MASVNKVILIGHLGRDPEIRRGPTGDPIANFRMATSESWKDKATGERKEKTEWHSVVIFNKNLAEVTERFLHKGSKVYVEGQLQTREWTDKENIKRYSTEVVLSNFRGEITLLDSQPSNRPPPADSPEDYGRRKSDTRPAAQQDQPTRKADLDDDIPF